MLKATRTMILTTVLIALPLGLLSGAILGIHLRPDPPPRSYSIDFRDFQIDGEFGQWEVVRDPDTGRWVIRRTQEKK